MTYSLSTARPMPRLRRFSLLSTLMRWVETSRQRAALRRLDDAALKDVGISASDAREEADRPFWDAPDHWHR